MKDAEELLDMYYLDMRSALLETAATLDRLERAEGYTKIKDDKRLEKIKHSLELIKTETGNRAEKFLEYYSDMS